MIAKPHVHVVLELFSGMITTQEGEVIGYIGRIDKVVRDIDMTSFVNCNLIINSRALEKLNDLKPNEEVTTTLKRSIKLNDRP